jgi:hypothetical protein
MEEAARGPVKIHCDAHGASDQASELSAQDLRVSASEYLSQPYTIYKNGKLQGSLRSQATRRSFFNIRPLQPAA